MLGFGFWDLGFRDVLRGRFWHFIPSSIYFSGTNFTMTPVKSRCSSNSRDNKTSCRGFHSFGSVFKQSIPVRGLLIQIKLKGHELKTYRVRKHAVFDMNVPGQEARLAGGSLRGSAKPGWFVYYWDYLICRFDSYSFSTVPYSLPEPRGCGLREARISMIFPLSPGFRHEMHLSRAYRVTSPTRIRPLLGPYRRPMPWSRFLRREARLRITAACGRVAFRSFFLFSIIFPLSII